MLSKTHFRLYMRNENPRFGTLSHSLTQSENTEVALPALSKNFLQETALHTLASASPEKVSGHPKGLSGP